MSTDKSSSGTHGTNKNWRANDRGGSTMRQAREYSKWNVKREVLKRQSGLHEIAWLSSEMGRGRRDAMWRYVTRRKEKGESQRRRRKQKREKELYRSNSIPDKVFALVAERSASARVRVGVRVSRLRTRMYRACWIMQPAYFPVCLVGLKA